MWEQARRVELRVWWPGPVCFPRLAAWRALSPEYWSSGVPVRLWRQPELATFRPEAEWRARPRLAQPLPGRSHWLPGQPGRQVRLLQERELPEDSAVQPELEQAPVRSEQLESFPELRGLEPGLGRAALPAQAQDWLVATQFGSAFLPAPRGRQLEPGCRPHGRKGIPHKWRRHKPEATT